MVKRKLTEQQEEALCARYLAGESSIKLSKEYGLASTSVRDIVRRNGIKVRSIKEAFGGLTSEAEAAVCHRYANGENQYDLSAALGVSHSTISRTLAKHGVETRRRGEQLLLYSPQEEAEICARYNAGESLRQLGRAYDIDSRTVRGILKRNGVESRSISQAKRTFSAEEESELCQRYCAGESSVRLAAEVGVTPVTIVNILHRNGFEARRPPEHGDSIHHILGGTGRHAEIRECEFYIYELARFPKSYCKPGIAFDSSLRADAEYGQAVLHLFFSTRAEAYLLEQAVLDATRGSAGCPEDLWDWAGSTEVRAMPASDLEPVALRLAESLEELGPWGFAAAHVPMSAAERMICQQRDLAGAPLASHCTEPSYPAIQRNNPPDAGTSLD